MRVPAALVVLALSVPAPSFGATAPTTSPGSRQSPSCPHTTSYLADAASIYRGAPLSPRKLTELPPGTTYMAVYRRIDGCDAPLTMVEYRDPRRR